MDANCVWQIVSLNGQFKLYISHSSCPLAIDWTWVKYPSSISTAQLKFLTKTKTEKKLFHCSVNALKKEKKQLLKFEIGTFNLISFLFKSCNALNT